MKVLMVCLGNICRSPLAEGIPREKAREAGLDWEIASVGTDSYHTGIDQDVPDPWYGSEPGYHEVYKMISTAADKIISKYGQPTKIS